MKKAILLLAFSTITLLSFAQTQSETTNGDCQDHIKITIATDSLIVKLKNKSLRLTKIQDLDSCLQTNLPGMTLPVADLESYTDLTPRDHRAIIVILDKYRCPVASEKRLSDGKVHAAVFSTKN